MNLPITVCPLDEKRVYKSNRSDFEIVDSSFIKITANMKKVIIDMWASSMIPEKDTVIVPFVNEKSVIIPQLKSPPKTGAFFPSIPPVLVNCIFRYDNLTAGDILHFAQYEAVASEVQELGPHRGRAYIGKPGPLIKENLMTLDVLEFEYEKQYFYSPLKDYLQNLVKGWM